MHPIYMRADMPTNIHMQTHAYLLIYIIGIKYAAKISQNMTKYRNIQVFFYVQLSKVQQKFWYLHLYGFMPDQNWDKSKQEGKNGTICHVSIVPHLKACLYGAYLGNC